MTVTRCSVAAAALFVVLSAPAAHAQGLPSGDLTGGVTETVGGTTGGVTETVGGVTGGVTETVGGTTDGVTETVGGTSGGVTETVGGTTGGVTETVGGTTGGVTETVGGVTGGGGGSNNPVNETIGGVTETVGELTGGGGGSGNGGKTGGLTEDNSFSSGASLLDGLLGGSNVRPPSLADIPANLLDDLVDGAAAGGITPAAAEGWIEGTKVQGTAGYDTPQAAVLSLSASLEGSVFDLAQTAALVASTSTDPSGGSAAESFFAEAGQAAVEAARTIVFPLALALLVAVFLVAQGRFGRKDPRLTVAPIDTRDEYLTFE